jgi:hypothetical protein
MAITEIAACSVAAAVAAGATTEFIVTGPFVLYADNYEIDEVAKLYRLGPSGDYLPATNKEGVIYVSAFPNMAYVDTGGTFRVSKTATSVDAVVGYEAV